LNTGDLRGQPLCPAAASSMTDAPKELAAGSDAQAAVRVIQPSAAKPAEAAAAAAGVPQGDQKGPGAPGQQHSGFPMLDKFLRNLELTQVCSGD
jgi:hypothetical protein